MMKILVAFAFILILIAPVTATSVTTVEIRGTVFDEKSSTYNTTLLWDAQKFQGFWYALGGGKSSETLKIVNQAPSSLTASSRVIQQENLQYNTSRTDQKYILFSEKDKKVENGLEYNSTTKTFTKVAAGGYYARLGWFGDLYVAVNGKANKLAKLIKEQKKDEKQILKLGTSWNLGEGYNITVESLDTTTTPRQAWLSLSKDGKTLDNKVVNEGEVYSYVEKSLSGESDVPVFVTYVESIFTGGEGMAAFVQLRYTWLISQNVLEVREEDKFGVFEVKEANENYLLLYNKDKTISLDQNTVQPLYGDFKFKVADSSTALRFYPVVEYTILPKPQAELKAANPIPTAAASVTPITASPPSSLNAASLTGTISPEHTETPAKLQQTDPLPKNLYWVLFATSALLAVGYLVLRKD